MLYNIYIKRMLDIVISMILVLPTLLICIIVGVLIKLEDRGTVFYQQHRLGKNMKPYKMIKLRSMKMNAPDLRNKDGSTYSSNHDSRVLKIGNFIRKSSIDELPQIFNVLMGHMSLIGPRPDLCSQAQLYDEFHMSKIKFKVKPGITGYAQCNGRNELTWGEKLELDHYYVEHCSFHLDVIIFIKTVVDVFKKRGVNKDDENNKRRI